MKLGATIWHKPSETKLIFLGKSINQHLIRVRRLEHKAKRKREVGPVGLAYANECTKGWSSVK